MMKNDGDVDCREPKLNRRGFYSISSWMSNNTQELYGDLDERSFTSSRGDQ
jgi:hypothetical protein